MQLSETAIDKIKELNIYDSSVDTEAGISKSCNAGVIFSTINPKQRAELMNLFRPSDWFTSSKRINFKKIEENCKKKIKQIINE